MRIKSKLVKTAKFVLGSLNDAKFVLAGQAITLAILALAFPTAIQLGSYVILSSLASAVLATILMAASAVLTFHLFDYTKVGKYTLSLANLTLKEKLSIFAATIVLAALGLQVFSLVLPAVIHVSNYFVALFTILSCEIVVLGVDRIEELLTTTDSYAGDIRQGKRRPKSTRRRR